MASEQGYRSQVDPRAVEAALPGVASVVRAAKATPESMGAGLGAAIGRAGDQWHRENLRDHQIEKRLTADREAADFAHRFALHRENMDGIVREIRANPTSPDYGEHVERIRQADEAGREGMLDGLTNGEVRLRAAAQLDSYRLNIVTNEGDYAESQRIAKVVSDTQRAIDIDANRIRQGVETEDYAQILSNGYALVDGLNGLTPVQKNKLRGEVEQTYGIAFLNHLTDSNPRAALAILDAGTYNEILKPEQIEAARNGAMVEVRRADAAAAHAVNVARSQLAEQIATLKERDSQGIDVSAELPAAMAAAAAAGDTSTVEQLKGIARSSAFAKVWSPRTPLEREARIRELNGVEAGRRTADQQAELQWLTDKRGALDSQFNNDRAGFVVEHGLPGEQPPPLDAGNPASFQARAQWQRSQARTYGRMDLLTRQEREGLSDRLGQGDAGYSEVSDMLAQFGGVAARQAARELAPNDTQLQQLVMLPAGYRKLARDGREVLRQNPQRLKVEDEDDKQAVAQYSQGFNRALQSVPQADRNGILNIANSIAAKLIADSGEQLTPYVFGRAIDLALGSVGVGKDKRGGIGSWNGQAFLVPDDMTAQRFTDRIFDFVKRNPSKGPVNPDGTPFNLRVARPVAVRPGVYQFYVGSRPVMTKGRDGKIASPWQFTFGGSE